MKVYLDIDGVLLTKKMRVPDHGPEFISYITQYFECYWLTTHCRAGENHALKYLSQFYAQRELMNLAKVKPTDWLTLKTEAIDFGIPFIWLEDYPFNAEKKVLEQHGCEDSLLLVDLNKVQELPNVQRQISEMIGRY